METGVSRGAIFLQGAHVTEFQPAGQQPVLWMSSSSWLEEGKPIRGGVPICFPWFGPHPTDPSQPGHGNARLLPWEVSGAARLSDGGVGLELRADLSPLQALFRVGFGRSLTMELTVELPVCSPPAPVRYEEAFHTYFSVGDIHQVSVEGLEKFDYVDTVGGRTEKKADGKPLRFASETDLIYQQTIGRCVIVDPALQRRILVDRAGSQSTVVWNPWIAKSIRMPDFGDHEWPGMMCLETANVGSSAVVLNPGQVHVLRTGISTAPLPKQN